MIFEPTSRYVDAAKRVDFLSPSNLHLIGANVR